MSAQLAIEPFVQVRLETTPPELHPTEHISTEELVSSLEALQIEVLEQLRETPPIMVLTPPASEQLDVLQMCEALKSSTGISLGGIRISAGGASVYLAARWGVPVSVVAKQRSAASSRRTHRVNRTVRSGGVVRYDGDVVVMGDVNPGAQVIASGNVMILGALKGVAHAGATGEEGCIVFALELNPIQIRIGKRIAVSPQGSSTSRGAQVAFVLDDCIAFESHRRFLAR
jgi:septum site-determining protein MinC